MKTYFVESGLSGCYFVRCLLPLQVLGGDGDYTSIKRERAKTPEDKSRAAQNADIVVFHRPEQAKKLELARILKDRGQKIVFDNDDTFKSDVGEFKLNDFMDKARISRGLQHLNEVTDAFIREADLVTCTTEFLRQEYLKLNPNVVVLPNCVDPFYFDEPLRNETDIIRIGIIGSIGITSDFDVLKPIMLHYKDDRRVQFVLFSLPANRQDVEVRRIYSEEYKFWDEMKTVMNLEHQPFVPHDEYFDTINNLKLDIAVIPRADTYFNRCKSNLKFLEVSMFEIPCIAQSFPSKDSPYEVDPEDAEHLILATDTKSWINALELLIANKEIRRTLGKKAFEYVKEKYDIEKNAYKWIYAYKTLL